uniref:Homeodomain mating-type protein n=1 Tax=Coprinellus disseminatus TaxID=71703 RepID=Q1WMP9_COPDI|nr:homeodomain mating-type protein [Coprinellus disseminatus]
MLPHPVDQEIIDSLDSYRTQFFSSLQRGQGALASFLSTWQAFELMFRGRSDHLHVQTLEKVYSFSSMVASVIEGVSETLSLNDRLCSDVSNVLDEPDIASGDGPSLAPYMKLASQWLVANIHNPYPSRDVRSSMAAQTNSSKKDIDSWFLDARKRIGWNDMRRKHFGNKQIDIVNAAKRFFLDIDPSHPLPQVVESEFAGIQLRALELHSAKFEESPLATRLDMSIIDMSNSLKASAAANKPREVRTPPLAKAARSYPSPQPSPGGPSLLSPSPTLSFLELPLASSKRGSSVLSDLKDEQERPSKRLRLPPVDSSCSASTEPQRQLSTSPILPETSLPSPVTSAFDETELRPPPHCPAPTDLKRKRRLSDTQGLPSPKRTSTSPRPHADSNPLPVAHATTEEFDWTQIQDFFTLPPPVSVFSTDIAEPVDVSLFDFSAWEQYGHEAVDLLQAASSSSSTFSVEAITSFSLTTQLVGSLDNGLSLFNPHSQTEPSGLLGELLCTKESGLYSLPNISSDFVPPANRTIDPIVLPTDANCLPDFPAPLLLTPQAILAQAQVTLEPAVATPKSKLQAKQEQLRLLQAQVAALTAEIASES